MRRPGRALAAVSLGACACAAAAAPATNQVKREQVPSWVLEAAGRIPDAGDAPVAWGLDERIVEPVASGGVRHTWRIVGRARTAEGLESLADFAVGYQKGDLVERLRAWTILPDATIRATEGKEYYSDVPAVSGGTDYEDSRARALKAQGASVGAVVAYEAAVLVRQDPGGESFPFGDLDSPTALSRFTLVVPPGWSSRGLLKRGEPVTRTEEGGRVTWTARDLKPVPSEELAPSADELLPLVQVHWWSPDGARGFENWGALGAWYHGLSEPVLTDPGEAAVLGRRLAPSSEAALLSSISNAFDYASRQVRYVSIQVGIGGMKPHSPAAVYRNRYGDCKDKTFLLRAIAGTWDRPSWPVLVRTRDMGPLEEEIPSLGQFNHVIAAVSLPEGIGSDLWSAVSIEGVGRVVFLDATQGEGTPWDLRDDVQGTRAVLVVPGGGRLVTLPEAPPAAGRIHRSFEARISDTGELTAGTLREEWTGTQAVDLRSAYAGRTPAERDEEISRGLQGRFPGSAVRVDAFSGLDTPGAPLLRETAIAGGKFAKRAGAMLIVDPAGVARSSMSPVLPPPPRRWPLRYNGSLREETVEIDVTVPAGWRPEALPGPFEVRTPEIEAVATWEMADGHLRYVRTARLLARDVLPERYAAFREAVGRLRGADARAIIFTR